MKIAIDAGCLGITDKRLQVGVYTVVKNLLIQLGKSDKKNEYFLYSFYPIEKNLLQQFGPRMKNIVLPSFGWLKISLPLRLLIDKVDVFIAVNQAIPLRLPFFKYKILGIFYDIAFEMFSELYAYAANVEKHKKQSRDLAHYADLLISISRSTKKDVVKYYHVDPEKIVVAYPGITLRQTQGRISKQFYKNPYFLFVGAFKKSKNIPNLLEAFSLFLEKTKKPYDLFLVGGDKWIDPEIEQTLAQLPANIQQSVKILGFVDDAILTSLYKSAIALVSPSWYEGFGLPFLEAQWYGCPVVASNRGSLPEILGESAICISPTNIQEISHAMNAISQNTALRKRLIAKGYKNVQKYSWKSFATLVQSAIESLA